MKGKICILDYGSGNVGSVYNMMHTLTENVVISNEERDIRRATHIVLPGVGAFGASMAKIKAKLPLKLLANEILQKKKPFLGICVGMQVLAEQGFEFGACSGLGWIKGKVIKLDAGGQPLPHIGWNSVEILRDCALTKKFSTPWPDFYFVHSFVLVPADKKNVMAKTNYGTDFCALVNRDNIYGVQFHPEKSQKAGKILLQNFLEL